MSRRERAVVEAAVRYYRAEAAWARLMVPYELGEVEYDEYDTAHDEYDAAEAAVLEATRLYLGEE